MNQLYPKHSPLQNNPGCVNRKKPQDPDPEILISCQHSNGKLILIWLIKPPNHPGTEILQTPLLSCGAQSVSQMQIDPS